MKRCVFEEKGHFQSHMKQCLFLETAAPDQGCVSCHPALTAIVT